MITIIPVLFDHQWKEDGTNFYRLKVTLNRKKKYIKTNIVVTKKDVARSGKLKSLEIQENVDDLVRRVRKQISSWDEFDVEMMDIEKVVARIKEELRSEEKFTLDFVKFGHKVAESKSPGNAKTYIVALNALVRFFKGRHPDISEITVRNLRAFTQFIQNEGVVKVNWRTGQSHTLKKEKGGRAASLYLSNIRHIYKSARMEYNDPDLGKFPIPNDPFDYFSLPSVPASKHRDVSPEVIQMMIDTRGSLTRRQRMAVDAFLISFGLCGMNAADMFTCAKPKGDILYYRRQKTCNRRDDGAQMWVKIHPCIGAIMDEYRDSDRCFDYYKRYADKDVFITALNQGLRGWIKKYGQDDFTFYSARHSWGTIGRSKRCQIDAKVITAGMCHVSEGSRMDDIYVKFDWELLWDAQLQILETFKW